MQNINDSEYIHVIMDDDDTRGRNVFAITTQTRSTNSSTKNQPRQAGLSGNAIYASTRRAAFKQHIKTTRFGDTYMEI